MTDAALAPISDRLLRLHELRRSIASGSSALIAEAFAALPAGAKSAAVRAICDGLDAAIVEARRQCIAAIGVDE